MVTAALLPGTVTILELDTKEIENDWPSPFLLFLLFYLFFCPHVSLNNKFLSLLSVPIVYFSKEVLYSDASQ